MINRLNQKSKKNRTWLFIGGGLAVIVILIGLFFGYNYWQQEQRRANAQAKTHEFVDTIEKQDYARLTSFLSPSSLEAIEYTSEL